MIINFNLFFPSFKKFFDKDLWKMKMPKGEGAEKELFEKLQGWKGKKWEELFESDVEENYRLAHFVFVLTLLHMKVT